MGNRIFGCDDCLDICPYNRPGQTNRRTGLPAQLAHQRPVAAGTSTKMDEQTFMATFKHGVPSSARSTPDSCAISPGPQPIPPRPHADRAPPLTPPHCFSPADSGRLRHHVLAHSRTHLNRLRGHAGTHPPDRRR
jgi:epoxyqueuosine reductase